MDRKMTRRQFLWGSIAGGAILGSGLGYPQGVHGQATNLRFSTWHVPVGRDVQTVWIPMMEELKKRSQGKLAYTMFAGSALGKGRSTMISCQRVCRFRILHRHLDARPIS